MHGNGKVCLELRGPTVCVLSSESEALYIIHQRCAYSTPKLWLHDMWVCRNTHSGRIDAVKQSLRKQVLFIFHVKIIEITQRQRSVHTAVNFHSVALWNTAAWGPGFIRYGVKANCPVRLLTGQTAV